MTAGSVGVGAVLGSAVFGPVSVWAGAGLVFGPVQFSGQCRCGLVQCRFGFRASVGAVFGPVSVRASAVFILNGMIFSFLDERRVFKGVV